MLVFLHGKLPTRIVNNLGCSNGHVYRIIKRWSTKTCTKKVPKFASTPDLCTATKNELDERKDMASIGGLAKISDKTDGP